MLRYAHKVLVLCPTHIYIQMHSNTHTHTDCQMGCVINRVCVCVYGGPFQFSFGDFSKNSLIWMWIDCEWGGILCSFSVLHFLFIASVRLFISWACVCVCMFGFYSPNTFNNIQQSIDWNCWTMWEIIFFNRHFTAKSITLRLMVESLKH